MVCHPVDYCMDVIARGDNTVAKHICGKKTVTYIHWASWCHAPRSIQEAKDSRTANIKLSPESVCVAWQPLWQKLGCIGSSGDRVPWKIPHPGGGAVYELENECPMVQLIQDSGAWGAQTQTSPASSLIALPQPSLFQRWSSYGEDIKLGPQVLTQGTLNPRSNTASIPTHQTCDLGQRFSSQLLFLHPYNKRYWVDVVKVK